jgi:general secretion pathway protein E
MQQVVLEISGRASQSRIELASDPITIGRHANNVVVLDDNKASRAHCVIEAAKKGYQVRDLNSSNGTYLNGQRVGAAPLKHGDTVVVGDVQILFKDLANEVGVEELSADDIVEDEYIEVSDHEKMNLGGTTGDYEESLTQIALSLPAGDFGEHEIALSNSKGRIIHEAGNVAKKVGNRRDIVGLLRLLLLVAFRSRSSDIHLEPRREGYTARLRLDGVLVDACQFPVQVGVKLASVVKVLGEIDLAQRDSIQEGSFSSSVPDARLPGGFRRVDYRVSFAPTVFGQKLVLRVLDAGSAPLKIQNLGLPQWMGKELANAITQEAGMVLVCGPTGSGKTTTLYALIRSIDVSQRNVVTIEDPVEIQLDGVAQMQVNEGQEKTFLTILRSVLRQDPDVILVGEIRDSETARVAMQAAITGHLVFSTVHTKDAAGSIFRLMDLGVEPFMISQGLHVVIAQRLVRMLCPHCKRPVKPTKQQLELIGSRHQDVQRLFEAQGCKKCLGSGFFGRRAVFELLVSNDKLRDIVLRNPTMTEVYKAQENTQFSRLIDTGIDLAVKGLVSLSEVERAVGK